MELSANYIKRIEIDGLWDRFNIVWDLRPDVNILSGIMTMNQEGYPVFKGLQKPLEFMGIRGRFLTLAAAAVGVSFVGFIVFSIILGKLAGFIAMLVMAVAGLVVIYVKQRGGLHNKRRSKGIFIYRHLMRNP